jgi:hypothetical protein
VNKNITKQHALRLQNSDDYDIRDDHEIDRGRDAHHIDGLKLRISRNEQPWLLSL